MIWFTYSHGLYINMGDLFRHERRSWVLRRVSNWLGCHSPNDPKLHTLPNANIVTPICHFRYFLMLGSSFPVALLADRARCPALIRFWPKLIHKLPTCSIVATCGVSWSVLPNEVLLTEAFTAGRGYSCIDRSFEAKFYLGLSDS